MALPIPLLLLLVGGVALVAGGAKKKAVRPGFDPRRVDSFRPTPGLKIPLFKLTLEQQLDHQLRAFIVLADLICQAGSDPYRRVILGPNAVPPYQVKQTPWIAEPGVPTETGFLYSPLLPQHAGTGTGGAAYAMDLWDKSPDAALTRAKWMNTYALAYAKFLLIAYYEWTKAAGAKMPPTGENDAGPDLAELVEDYSQQVVVSYLAAALPGGVVVLPVAADFGITWGGFPIYEATGLNPSCRDNRWRVTLGASELIAHAYANPAPAVIATATVKS